MKTLRRLMLLPPELERLCGLEVGELWVGSLWSGAYRPGAWQRQQLPKILALELGVLGVMGVLSVPVGLLLVRLSGQTGQGGGLEGRQAVAFGLGIGGAILVLSLLRQVVMRQQQWRLRSLLPILEEVDRFHDTLQAFELLQQLSGLGPSPSGYGTLREAPVAVDSIDVEALEAALMLTRDSLVTGLMAERLLRQQHLSHSDDLLDHLEQNLTTLHSLTIGRQAAEQAVLLRETLQISHSVQQELRSLLS